MQLIEAQDTLISIVRAAYPELLIMDNIVETPQVAPYIAIDIDTSDTSTHAGGTLPPEQHNLAIYAVDSLLNHGDSIRNTRGYVSQLINSILALPRVYALDKIHYGEDVIANQRCCLAMVRISFPN